MTTTVSTAIVATEIGMLHPLREAAPDIDFVAANEAASCRYMKMITLPKLRDSLRDGRYEVRVDAATADRAQIADRAHGRHRLIAADLRAATSSVARVPVRHALWPPPRSIRRGQTI